MAVFDGIAGDYDGWYLTRLGDFVDRVETALAFEMFPAGEGLEVLDAGCGTGNFSLKLARRGCQVTGIDLSPAMLEVAREKADRGGLGINFRQMDIYCLEFPDEYFDAVFSMAAFEFVEHPGKALGEILRVVKKGGPVLIGTINGDSPWGELYRQRALEEDSIFRHAHFKTPEEMRKLAGDRLVEVRQCLFIPPDAAEDQISMERERELARTEGGGFICGLWRK